jgi:hypothetical protein
MKQRPLPYSNIRSLNQIAGVIEILEQRHRIDSGKDVVINQAENIAKRLENYIIDRFGSIITTNLEICITSTYPVLNFHCRSEVRRNDKYDRGSEGQ